MPSRPLRAFADSPEKYQVRRSDAAMSPARSSRSPVAPLRKPFAQADDTGNRPTTARGSPSTKAQRNPAGKAVHHSVNSANGMLPPAVPAITS